MSKKGRDGAGRFQPGTSGNPGGLPAYVRAVRILAGQKALRAVTRLGEMVEDRDPRVALPACLAVLDRAGVRPMELHVNLGNRDRLQDLLDHTPPELDAAELERLVKAPTPRAAPPASAISPDDGGEASEGSDSLPPPSGFPEA